VRICTGCGINKSLENYPKCSRSLDGYRRRCKQCRKNAYSPEGKRAWKLKAYYGITVEEYDKILESQNNVCAICKKMESRGTRLSVDHDHTTLVVRGLVCKNCNLVLGYAQDNPEYLRNAAHYLERGPK
jgi:hypothetical protein